MHSFQFWKRKEKGIALEWGTIDFESAEVDRAGIHILFFEKQVSSRYFYQLLRNTTPIQAQK